MKVWVCLIVVIGLLSCSVEDVDSNDYVSVGDRTRTYLALGDSYTAATGENPEFSYPNQLVNRLDSVDSINVDLEVIATNGWTTRDLIQGISNTELSDSYDVVSLLIGVNNQFQRRPFKQYRTEFINLLDSCIVYAGGNTDNVFVFSIPDYGYTAFGRSNKATISRELDQYNSFADSVCQIKNVDYYYITDISREAEDKPALIAPDSLHPSALQYELWIDKYYDVIKEKFK